MNAKREKTPTIELISDITSENGRSEIWLSTVEESQTTPRGSSFSLYGTGKALVARFVYTDNDEASQAMQIMKRALRRAAMEI
jgi:hypothetical protein